MKISKSTMLFSLALLPLTFGGCSDEPSVQKYKVSKTPLPSHSGPDLTSSSAGEVVDTGLSFTWVVPAGWESGKASSMRLASYNIPLSTGETGDFSLVRLGGAAGGVLANINRWRGQIGLEHATIEEVAEFSHMHTTSQGRQFLHATLINEANPDSSILGAIFQVQESDFVLFAKLTASAAGVQEANESFEAFCNSINFKEL